MPKAIGAYLGLPEKLVQKTPIDGLSGLSDEENLGFTYTALDTYIRTGVCEDEEVKARYQQLRRIDIRLLAVWQKHTEHSATEKTYQLSQDSVGTRPSIQLYLGTARLALFSNLFH